MGRSQEGKRGGGKGKEAEFLALKPLMQSGLQLIVGTHPTGWERPNTEAQTLTVEAIHKILHNTRKRTDLYSGLPYTESTGQST